MSEAMWKRDDGLEIHAGATWEMYTEAINKFTGSARSFMEHVHLLTEAWTAYQEAMTVGAELRKRLDTGDQALRSLMTRLEQVVNNHLSEPTLEKKRPELVKDDAARTGSGAMGTGGVFP